MIHNLHILLGNSAEQNISRLKEYAIKYGSEYVDEEGERAVDYLQLMLYTDDGQFLVAQKKEQDKSVFTLGVEDRYAAELQPCKFRVGENPKKGLVGFFRRLYLDTVNLHRPGDGALHVAIHVPLFSATAWDRARELMEAMESTQLANYSVDLFLIASDLVHVLGNGEDVSDDKYDEFDEIAKKTLKKIIDTKVSGKFSKFQNILLVQNQNEDGIALDLDIESYTNLIGELALSTTSYYNKIFTANFLMATRDQYPILGVGISMLHFDRFYFVQYMLRKAYSHILDREGINEMVDKEGVDIATISGIVQNVLKPNINIFSTIFDKEVEPRLQRKMSQEDIMAEIQPLLKVEMARLEEEFLAYMDREDLSLPAKRVALAQLLGEDDELMRGQLFHEDQLIIDECRREVQDIFVDANNKLADIPEGVVDGSERPLRDYAALCDVPGERVETARERIQKIKEKKIRIKESTDYIRTQTKMLMRLDDSSRKEEERHKRFTEHGFEFDEQVYRLLPKNIERPLSEDYVPQPGKLPTEVDLRQHFTRIKDQGSSPACAAYAIVSIYEYILRKNNHKEVDLSEYFAYYNARQLMDAESTVEDGTSLYHVIKGMGEKGICLDSAYKDATDVNETPPEGAYKDAETRKISKALNVECNVDHIKSAVASGYPVAIALRIFDSFVSDTGFVPRPSLETDTEHEQGGSHALVVCGYSDEQKVFIVRNSWGERFGDKGYCYIPYSYISDPEMLLGACIITEISMADIKVEGTVGKVSVSFNKADAKVHAAILKNQIEEEECHLKILESELDLMREEYLGFVTRLGVPDVRRRLRDGTEERLKLEIEETTEKRKKLIEERNQKRDEFDADSRRIGIYSGLVVVGMVLFYTLMMMYWWDGSVKDYLRSGVGVFNALQVLGIISLFASPFIGGVTRKYVLGDEAAHKYDTRRSRMWTIWVVTIFVMVVAYILLSLYKVITPWPIGLGWRWLILGLSFVPFVDSIFSRNYVVRDLEEYYDGLIADVAREKIDMERELSLTKMKMHISGSLLDSVTTLITALTQKYYSLHSYVNNLRQWYKENLNKEEEIPVNRQPFMSLVESKCLDEYFEKHADDLTDGVRLYRLFKTGNYEVSEEQIVAFKNGLKDALEKELESKVADFSISEYVTGARTFEYVSDKYVNVNKLLCTMDQNSQIFVRTAGRIADGATQDVKCKMLFREPANAGLWDSHVSTNFSLAPTLHDVNSPYKLFVIRLEGLQADEVSILK